MGTTEGTRLPFEVEEVALVAVLEHLGVRVGVMGDGGGGRGG
jgi:hypothetical protein